MELRRQRDSISFGNILGKPSVSPLITVYTGFHGTPPNGIFSLVALYNITTVLTSNPKAKNPLTHTFKKFTLGVPGGSMDFGFIGVDASGNDLYKNNLFLGSDRCTVDTSYPSLL